MAQSPDSNILAYVRLEEKVNPCRSNSLAGVDVVKVIQQGYIPAEVYQAVYFRIMTLEWLEDGRLLIWDAPTDLEESPGVTIVYDPQAGGIVRRLPFPLDERVAIWNTPRNAFYTAVFSVMESKCTEYMGGYDFAQERELPSLNPDNAPSQHVHIVGNPLWSEVGTQLLASVSIGKLIGNSPCGDGQIEWGPSSIMMLDLNAEDLQPVMVKGDNEHNYYLQVDSNGRYEITSEPYSPSYSQCCRCC